MEKIKNNWLLIGALMFFLTSAGFTTANSLNSTFLEPECYICGSSSCYEASGDQIGETDCTDVGGECELVGGFLCIENPQQDPPGRR